MVRCEFSDYHASFVLMITAKSEKEQKTLESVGRCGIPETLSESPKYITA